MYMHEAFFDAKFTGKLHTRYSDFKATNETKEATLFNGLNASSTNYTLMVNYSFHFVVLN